MQVPYIRYIWCLCCSLRLFDRLGCLSLRPEFKAGLALTSSDPRPPASITQTDPFPPSLRRPSQAGYYSGVSVGKPGPTASCVSQTLPAPAYSKAPAAAALRNDVGFSIKGGTNIYGEQSSEE